MKNLLGIFSLGVITSFVRIISQLVLNKLIAVFLGLNNYSIITNFQNLIALSTNLSGGIFNTGVVRLVSKDNNEKRIGGVFSTAMVLVLSLTFTLSILLFVFSNTISLQIFNTKRFSNIISLLSVVLLTFSINQLLISFLNGKRKIKEIVIAETLNRLVLTIIPIFFIMNKDIIGFFYSLVLCQIICVTITYFVSKQFLLNLRFYFIKSISKELIFFSFASVITGALAIIIKLFLRNIILNEYGPESSGIWDSINKLSQVYFIILLFPINKFFLPKISSSNSLNEIKLHIKSISKLILPICILGFTFLLLFKTSIIEMFFSQEFSSISKYIHFQVIGDFFRLGCIIISFTLLGRSQINAFIFNEIIFSLNFIGLFFLLKIFLNEEAIYYAYSLNSILSLLISISTFYFIFKQKTVRK